MAIATGGDTLILKTCKKKVRKGGDTLTLKTCKKKVRKKKVAHGGLEPRYLCHRSGS